MCGTEGRGGLGLVLVVFSNLIFILVFGLTGVLRTNIAATRRKKESKIKKRFGFFCDL